MTPPPLAACQIVPFDFIVPASAGLNRLRPALRTPNKSRDKQLRACGRINDRFHKESIGPYGISLGPQRASWRLLGPSDRELNDVVVIAPLSFGSRDTLWLKCLPSGPAEPEPEGRGWLILQQFLSSSFADFGRLNRFQEMSASGPFFGKLVGAYANKIAWQGSRLMELTNSFLTLLQQCAPVFTAPTFQTFLQVVTGWILSHRHRYVTDILFSSGNVDNGHWSRFHRFFSHAAWDMDVLCLHLVRLVVSLLAPGALLLWAVDDTLCRKRGLTLYGAGMHHDPLLSSRAKPLVSWGHDWVVLCLVIVNPFWAPGKVFALPIVMRLYRNRQGLTKGKKSKRSSQPKADPNHRTRPQLAVELMTLVSTWFPHDDLLITGDSAYGGRSVLSHLPANVHLISRVHPKGALYAPPPPHPGKRPGAPRKKGARLPGLAACAAATAQPCTAHLSDPFGLHPP